MLVTLGSYAGHNKSLVSQLKNVHRRMMEDFWKFINAWKLNEMPVAIFNMIICMNSRLAFCPACTGAIVNANETIEIISESSRGCRCLGREIREELRRILFHVNIAIVFQRTIFDQARFGSCVLFCFIICSALIHKQAFVWCKTRRAQKCRMIGVS